MTAYLIRRVGTSLVILIGISIFVFVLLHSVFPSPAIVVLGPKASPRAVADWNAQNGFGDFFLYLIAVQILAISIPVFSFEASQSTSIVTVIGDVRAMALPIACIALLVLAGYSRYMRSAAIETLAQDYIKAARAKGLPERLVLFRHLLRNACLPMITLIGLSVPSLLAGNLVAEFVFNYPGLGLLFYNSLSNEDYPVLIAYTLIGAVLTVLGNLLADIALTIADPRIRLR
jgi:peptide/nickel transport system permease protein